MKNLPLLLGTIGFTLLMIVGIAFFFSGDPTSPEEQLTPVAAEVLVGDAVNVRGATESATVTVVEFSDLECPACRAAQPLVTQLLAEYGDQVQFVFRHYPLVSIHPNAQPAAVFAQAAADQGKFWEVKELLFASQPEWSAIRDSEELTTTFLGYAESLGLSTSELETTMKDARVLDIVRKDMSDGNTAGITGTPTFFVNGVRTPAPQLLSTVASLLVVDTSEQEQPLSEE